MGSLLKKQNLRVFCLLLTILFNNTLIIRESFATGKAPPNRTSPHPSTPVPIRKILLPQIGTQVFQLPNGVMADLNIDLQTLLNTAVTSTGDFSPTESNDKNPCNSYLELRSAVTTFQLDVVDAGVSFGYTPSGTLVSTNTITSVAKVKVGMIAMDFSIWQCNEGSCSSIVATTSNHLVVGTNITFELDFGRIKAGSELIYNPVLSEVLRKIMKDAMRKLVSSPRISELPWTALVREYNPSLGVLVFDAGDESGLSSNQTFVIYAPTDNTPQGVCHVFQAVAFVHTTLVTPVSSEAVIDQVLDPRGVQVGDVVMVRRSPPN